MHPIVDNHRAALAEIGRKHGVRRLAVFGSAARGDFDTARSDVDLLAEFADPLAPGYADRFLDFALAAEALLGRRVDVLTTRSVKNPIFRRQIEKDLEEIYAAA